MNTDLVLIKIQALEQLMAAASNESDLKELLYHFVMQRYLNHQDKSKGKWYMVVEAQEDGTEQYKLAFKKREVNDDNE